RAGRGRRDHGVDVDVIGRFAAARAAAVGAAAGGPGKLLAAAEPDLLAAAPLRRHPERAVRREQVRVVVAAVRAIVEEMGIAVEQLTNVEVILRVEPHRALPGRASGRDQSEERERHEPRYGAL